MSRQVRTTHHPETVKRTDERQLLAEYRGMDASDRALLRQTSAFLVRGTKPSSQEP
jgi:hypothetical protein